MRAERPTGHVPGWGHSHARCWGWYFTFDAALKRMREDTLFFEDRHYTWGLIETYREGSCIAEAEAWFTPVYAEGSRRSEAQVDIVPCGKPVELERIVSFLI